MRTLILFSTFLLLISCSPNFKKNFKVIKTDNDYSFWIDYYNKEKDSIEINWLVSFKITNSTWMDIKFFRIRKRPEYSFQSSLMIENDSLVLFDEMIKKKSEKELIIYCTKIVPVKDFPKYAICKKNCLKNFGEWHRNITKIPKEQKEFKKSDYFKNILKSIENDSIAIVFRDLKKYDYFQFKGVIKDKKLKFSR